MADKTIIHVQVQDQKLVLLSGPVVASGGVNGTAVEFDLSPEWDDMVITAAFQREDNGTVYHAATDAYRRAVVPQEVLKEDGYMLFGIFGVLDNEVRTSEVMRYRVKRGAITEDDAPSSPTPELWEQLLNAVNAVTPVVQQVRAEMTQLTEDTEEALAEIQALTDQEIDEAIAAAEADAADMEDTEADG